MVTIDVYMIWQQASNCSQQKTIKTSHVLQHQLHDYKSGFWFMRKYNLKRNLLSIELSPKLGAKPSFIRKNYNAGKLIEKCVRLIFKYKYI